MERTSALTSRRRRDWFTGELIGVLRFSAWLTFGLYAVLSVVVWFDRELVRPFFEPAWLLGILALNVLLLAWVGHWQERSASADWSDQYPRR